MPNLQALREAIEESPENVPLLLLFAHSCLEELSFSEAREGFEAVLNLRANHAEARLGIARILFLDGKQSEAVVRAQAVLCDEPGFAPAHLFLSRLFLNENDHEEAVKHYRRAVEISKSIVDPALEKALASSTRERRGRKESGAKDAGAETGWRYREDDERSRDSGFDAEDEIPSFFDDLEGVESLENPQGFSTEDFPRPSFGFDQVCGLDALKEEIRMKIVHPLAHPELFRSYGVKAGGSLLLYGPPGCGKTLLARAIAGETGAAFFEVGLQHVLEMYVGEGERDLGQIFELARAQGPAVVFIDELDALAADLTTGDQRRSRVLTRQLRQGISRANSGEDGLFLIAATNAPWNLDEVLAGRPRFGQKVLVKLPDVEAREAICRLLAEDKPILDLDTGYLAKKTEGFSGADLKAMFDMASSEALGVALKEGRIVPLTMAMLVQCSKRLHPVAPKWEEKLKEIGRGSI